MKENVKESEPKTSKETGKTLAEIMFRGCVISNATANKASPFGLRLAGYPEDTKPDRNVKDV